MCVYCVCVSCVRVRVCIVRACMRVCVCRHCTLMSFNVLLLLYYKITYPTVANMLSPSALRTHDSLELLETKNVGKSSGLSLQTDTYHDTNHREEENI